MWHNYKSSILWPRRAPLFLILRRRVKKANLSVSEFNEFKPRLKSAKNRFQMSTGLNIETLNTILSGTNHIWAAA